MEPINGIRAMAFAAQGRVPVGQAAHLTVLFQNVSDRDVELPEMYLMPTVALSLAEHPFGKDHRYNAIIEQSIPDTFTCILWDRQAVMARPMNEPTLLRPGELRIASITLAARKQDMLKREEYLREVTIARGHEDVTVQELGTELLLQRDPGVRDLKLVFRPHGFRQPPGLRLSDVSGVSWENVEFRFPPVRIEIVDPATPSSSER